MIEKLLGTLLAAVIAGYLYSIQIFEQCPNISVIHNVDLNEMKGIWYVYQTTTPLKKDRRCFMVNFTFEEDGGHSGALAKEIWIHNNEKKTMDVRVSPGKHPSHYLVQWVRVDQKEAWMINYVYDKFVVFYICWPKHPNGGVLFIYTRQRHPDKATIETSQKSISDADFIVTKPHLYTIDHSGCSELEHILNN